jgi:hypothetical protein
VFLEGGEREQPIDGLSQKPIGVVQKEHPRSQFISAHSAHSNKTHEEKETGCMEREREKEGERVGESEREKGNKNAAVPRAK